MHLSPEHYADVVVLAPTGRIDHGAADRFRAAVEPWLSACRAAGNSNADNSNADSNADSNGRPSHALVFDLAGLDYISSAGLRVLMLASKQTRPAGGRILVAAMTPLVAEIFKISRFDMVFPTHATLPDALAALSPAAAAAFASRAP